jgi:hypothetical protein
MKEKIYTIPITEVFESPCFCPFCALEKRLNDEEVTYALGPAMMEPDYRILTNEKGFCQAHMKELNSLPKILPLALVQQSVLDAALVCRLGHLAAQRVQLPDKVALARATDGGIAGHIAHRIQIDGEHDGFHAQPGGGQRRLDAGMACAHYGDIKLSGEKFRHNRLSFV